jgi:hypothetical protein
MSGCEHLGGVISWITRTQGKKGARSILEKDQSKWSRRAPRTAVLASTYGLWCSPSSGKYFMHLLIRVLEFVVHKF